MKKYLETLIKEAEADGNKAEAIRLRALLALMEWGGRRKAASKQADGKPRRRKKSSKARQGRRKVIIRAWQEP